MKWTALLFGCLLVAASASEVFAAPNTSSTGATCESTGTARKDGKDENGNKFNCKWDTCTYLQCGTGGGSISNCVRKTEYSNPTDCHPAAAHTTGQSLVNNNNLTFEQTRPPRRTPPQTTGGNGGRNSGEPPSPRPPTFKPPTSALGGGAKLQMQQQNNNSGPTLR